MKLRLTVIFALVLLVLACNKDKFETKPTIRIKSTNTDVVPFNGTYVITLESTDKEGDVQDSVIIIKNRQNIRVVPTIRDTIRYKIPVFPLQSKTEIEVTMDFQTILSAINPPNIVGSNPPQKESDTLILKLAVRDTAGHTSDTILSKPVIVLRQ